MTRFIFPVLACLFLLNACKKETVKPSETSGKFAIEFIHQVEGKTLRTDSLCYVNEAGNHYMVNELKYFISDAYLHQNNGSQVHIDAQTAIHYVDIDYPETLKWNIFDPIPNGTYDSVSFIFGLNEQRNYSFAFVNPPEVNIFWPGILGGGYHYLMLNGKWENDLKQVNPFDFHLGIGQIYSGSGTNVDSITVYVQNYFEIRLPLNQLAIKNGTCSSIQLVMNIESWFKTPHTWDFNYWGNYIMQNQAAMQEAKENGYDVFEIETK